MGVESRRVSMLKGVELAVVHSQLWYRDPESTVGQAGR